MMLKAYDYLTSYFKVSSNKINLKCTTLEYVIVIIYGLSNIIFKTKWMKLFEIGEYLPT